MHQQLLCMEKTFFDGKQQKEKSNKKIFTKLNLSVKLCWKAHTKDFYTFKLTL